MCKKQESTEEGADGSWLHPCFDRHAGRTGLFSRKSGVQKTTISSHSKVSALAVDNPHRKNPNHQNKGTQGQYLG